MKKSLIILSLILLMSSLSISAAAAANDSGYESQVNNQAREKEGKIQKVFEERARLLLEHPAGYEKEYEKLGKKLRTLGVEFLTGQEIKEKMAKTGEIIPMVELPNQNNIVWTSFRNVWVLNGISYEVQHVGAEPNSLSSNLKETGAVILQSSYQWQAGTMGLAASIAKEASGAIHPGVDIAITVYDAVNDFINDIQPSTEVTNITSNYTYSYINNIDFMFVKEVGEDDDSQWLSYISNKVIGTIGWQIPTFSYKVNGAIENTQIQGGSSNFSYTGTGHRNGSYAVQNYVYPYSNPDTGFIDSVPLTGIENKTIKKLNPLTPNGMGYVY